MREEAKEEWELWIDFASVLDGMGDVVDSDPLTLEELESVIMSSRGLRRGVMRILKRRGVLLKAKPK